MNSPSNPLIHVTSPDATMNTVLHASTTTRPAAKVADSSADALFQALYEDLCRLARREVRRNGASDMLSTRTVVHEAWLDISSRPSLAFESNGSFLAYASRAMRGLVIDRLRSRQSVKRGGGFVITSLDTHHADQVAQPEFLQQVGDALDELSTRSPNWRMSSI